MDTAYYERELCYDLHMGGPQSTNDDHCFCYASVRSWLFAAHLYQATGRRGKEVLFFIFITITIWLVFLSMDWLLPQLAVRIQPKEAVFFYFKFLV